ncbi:MAG TPA: HAD-IIIC family phosphatase [Candidatus Sulfotelmatobacter sp.]|nr:HAD-IIIC family phosphatase [Candidatus Sulfotelmatobacter sp.]
MARVDCPGSVNSYVLKIRFKRWAKLWAPGNIRIRSLSEASKLEKQDFLVGSAIYHIPLPRLLKSTITNERYRMKKRAAHRILTGHHRPTSFIIECYNPTGTAVTATLTMRSVDENVKLSFQRLIFFPPGFYRGRVAIESIERMLDMKSPFNVELTPNDAATDEDTTLYFGLMEFVQEKEGNSTVVLPTKRVKCVVWDLDNTVWDGILVEDGLENVRLKPGIIEVLKVLDSRGILNSIASKNDPEDAHSALKKFGIDELFLCPQVSWSPKSEALQTISRKLNIGRDSLLFVDDSPFELEEVKARCPDVFRVNAKEYLRIPALDECQGEITSESAKRREMYRVEADRQAAADSYGDNYTAFLRDCSIHLNIRSMDESNLDRVHELTQRTNQMNFSGNRYTRDMLKEIGQSAHLDAYVLDCEDKFGSYGIVGFCVIDNREPRLVDLMFSCRVQSKRVEHAFLTHMIRQYISESGRDFYASYRRTPRNAVPGRVFTEVGMREIGISEGVITFVFENDRPIESDNLVSVESFVRPEATA